MNEVLRYAMLLCLAFSQPFGNFGIHIRWRLLGYISPDSRRRGHELFRRFICSTLGEGSELQIIGEASDGLEAVRKAEELHPDLILLDIGLPSLNGIEAARRIHKLSQNPRYFL